MLYRRFGKRATDIVVAGLVLLVAAPVMAGVALAVRLGLGSPVLFRQERPGLHGKPFELVKFRSMLPGNAPDDERMTPFGTWLRNTSLDELPELWNVLRGDMSLVGPRPLLVRYLPLYNDRQRKRHEVRPGLTGLAQVSGRNALDWPERLELDATYAEQLSLRLDVRILWRTIHAVRSAEGVVAEGTSTGTFFDDYLASLEETPRASRRAEES